MPTIDLSDDELEAVAAALRRAIASDRRPRGPRLQPFRTALAKIDPSSAPQPPPERLPPLPRGRDARGTRRR